MNRAKYTLGKLIILTDKCDTVICKTLWYIQDYVDMFLTDNYKLWNMLSNARNGRVYKIFPWSFVYTVIQYL